jgi:hypothetical protein
MGSPAPSNGSSNKQCSPRPPSYQHQHQQPTPQQQNDPNQQEDPRRTHIPAAGMRLTTMRPAPYDRRMREQQRQRRLDERMQKYLEKRQVKQQQKEIEDLERKIERQNFVQLKETEFHEREKQMKRNRKRGEGSAGLLRLLRDRHKEAGNMDEVDQFNSVLYGNRRLNDDDGRQKFRSRDRELRRPEKVVLIPYLRD